MVPPSPCALRSITRLNFSSFDTPRIVNVPSTSKVLAPVWTILVDLNVMYGSWAALKKSLLFSLSSFMPLPVFTVPAEILISRTPVESSGEVNFSVASHFWKSPWMATEAFTKNLIVLSPGVTTKTGASAWLSEGSAADAIRQNTASRILPSLRLLRVACQSFTCREPPLRNHDSDARARGSFRACACVHGRDYGVRPRRSPAWPPHLRFHRRDPSSAPRRLDRGCASFPSHRARPLRDVRRCGRHEPQSPVHGGCRSCLVPD